jgi:asparagine synthase (glutamine-hydrolysing)
MRAITGDVDALLVQPLADPGFLAALAASGGARGIGDRTGVMRNLFEGLLPDALLARSDKARFARAFSGGESAAFIDTWQGGGVDADLVDPEILKREWQNGVIDRRSTLLLHSAWLNRQ